MNEPSKIVVRPGAPDDAAALGSLGELLVVLHHAFDPSRFIAPGPGTKQGYGRYLASALAREDVIVLVAEENSVVLGYAYAGLEGADWMALRGPAGVIYDLVVASERRREGIGRRLLDAAVDALAARGAEMIVLSTATNNETAQRLFAAAGFRPTMLEMTRNLP
ncbi:MAG TPA: GNAT family N-acetyltransferase [Caulobacteraceae bacterium]|nr:GNAT family N-acetyltransferase [Caulobacteraceae bacterium]